MDAIDTRLAELDITLPEPFPPVGNYVSCVQTGDLLFVGGHGPVGGGTTIVGKVGTDLTLEQARNAARVTRTTHHLAARSPRKSASREAIRRRSSRNWAMRGGRCRS